LIILLLLLLLLRLRLTEWVVGSETGLLHGETVRVVESVPDRYT